MNELSGRFVLRIAPSLHAQLRRLSLERGVSLNELCREALESYVDSSTAPPKYADLERSPIVDTAGLVAGDSLVGVVLFGSRARGEETPSSDMDVFIIVTSDIALDRDLYRRWDTVSRDQSMSPHFVHLPADTRAAGSIWYEVALDGIVLYEKNLAVTRLLQSLRRAMADGVIVRRSSHGHPYWVKHPEDLYAE
jgi:predicted nucleotidyltransferase